MLDKGSSSTTGPRPFFASGTAGQRFGVDEGGGSDLTGGGIDHPDPPGGIVGGRQAARARGQPVGHTAGLGDGTLGGARGTAVVVGDRDDGADAGLEAIGRGHEATPGAGQERSGERVTEGGDPGLGHLEIGGVEAAAGGCTQPMDLLVDRRE